MFQNVSLAVTALSELSESSFEETIVMSVEELLSSLLLLRNEARHTALVICADELVRYVI